MFNWFANLGAKTLDFFARFGAEVLLFFQKLNNSSIQLKHNTLLLIKAHTHKKNTIYSYDDEEMGEFEP